MYGSYKPPFTIKAKNLRLSVKKENGIWKYERVLERNKKSLLLAFSSGEIIINPVEPVNLPKEICSNLLLEFSEPIILGPKEKVKVYVTFPIEIAVLASSGNVYRVLDVFSFVKPKYTLYGDVARGFICKYWKTDTSVKIPRTDPLKEGVMELNIFNSSGEWLDVREAVFNAYGMKIYYNKNLVSMKGKMKVISEDIAETSFINAPLKTNMKKSIELYLAKKLVIPLEGKFVMEEGV